MAVGKKRTPVTEAELAAGKEAFHRGLRDGERRDFHDAAALNALKAVMSRESVRALALRDHTPRIETRLVVEAFLIADLMLAERDRRDGR